MEDEYIESDIDLFDEDYTRRDVRIATKDLTRENIGRELETLCSNGIITDENYEEVVKAIADRCVDRGYQWPSQVKRFGGHYDSKVPIDRRFLIQQREGFSAYDRGLRAERVTKGMNEERKKILDKYLPGWLDEEDMWQRQVARVASYKERFGNVWPVPIPTLGKRILSEETLSALSEMNKDETIEFFELGEFLREQRKMLQSLASSGSMFYLSRGCPEIDLYDTRVGILDAELPGWSETRDTWNWMVEMLEEWMKDHAGSYPLLTRQLKECVSDEQLLEHSLALFVVRMQRSLNMIRTDEETGARYGFTKERKKILDQKFPGWKHVRVQTRSMRIRLKRPRPENLRYESDSESNDIEESPGMVFRGEDIFIDESIGVVGF